MVRVPLYPPAASKAVFAAAASNVHESPQVPALKPSTDGETQPVAGVTVLFQICLVIRSRSMAREMALRRSGLSLSCGSSGENVIQLIRLDSRCEWRTGQAGSDASPINLSSGML